MFTVDHFIWIGLCTAFVIVMTLLSRKFKWSFKTATYIMAGIALGSEVFKIATHMFSVEGRWSIQFPNMTSISGDGMYLLPKSLPFHLCSILIFFIFYLAVAKNEKTIETVKSFIVPICIFAGILAIIIETTFNTDEITHVFDSFDFDSGKKFDQLSPYQYFIYHAGIVWYGIYLISTKQVKFGLKVWIKNSIIMFAILVFAIWMNSFLIEYETNFMFTVEPPAKGLPLLNLKHGWYVYMVHYILIAGILTFLFQLPAIIKQRKLVK